MAFVPVPKDLTAVKTKVLFNLTKRQLICFGSGAAIGVPLFFLVKAHAASSVAALTMIVVMLPFFMLAMYEKNGQPLEKVIHNIIQVSFVRQKRRPFVTNNFYAVLERQTKLDTPNLTELRFENMEYLQKNGLSAAYENYAAVYSDSLQTEKAQGETLDDIYTRFNIDRPEDFTGHSLSVSDIIVLRQQGRVSCHYVDSFGFQELPQFLPENYLKNAEMAMEDDYGMIDGIINNGKSAAATVKELPDDERPSVLEKLRSFSRNEPQEPMKKAAPKRSAEREI